MTLSLTSLLFIAWLFSTIAVAVSITALIKVMAWERSTHKIEYVSPKQKRALASSLGLTKDEEDSPEIGGNLKKAVDLMFDNLGNGVSYEEEEREEGR